MKKHSAGTVASSRDRPRFSQNHVTTRHTQKKMAQSINICGTDYPCRITMGAMRRFKARTGVDISEVGNDTLLFIDWLWCCIDSACRADRRPFDIPDPDALADKLTPQELQDVAQQFAKATIGSVPSPQYSSTFQGSLVW